MSTLSIVLISFGTLVLLASIGVLICSLRMRRSVARIEEFPSVYNPRC